VLISTLDAAPVTDGLLPVLPLLLARHRLVLAAVEDTRIAELAAGRGDAEAVYAAAAAERTRSERAATGALLTRRGVRVVAAGPDELPPALADTYLGPQGLWSLTCANATVATCRKFVTKSPKTDGPRAPNPTRAPWSTATKGHR